MKTRSSKTHFFSSKENSVEHKNMRVYIGGFLKLEKVNIFLARKQTFNFFEMLFFTFISLDGFGYKSNLNCVSFRLSN